jgi:hypothetical protein
VKQPKEIKKPEGKLGILLPGLGAVSTTTIAGLGKPFGSLTQLGTIRLGKRTDNRSPLIKDFVPLASSTTWSSAAGTSSPTTRTSRRKHAAVLERSTHRPGEGRAREGDADEGVFYPEYVKRLHGTHVKEGARRRPTWSRQVRQDIRTFMKEKGCERAVAVWCGSTEIYSSRAGPSVHRRLREGPARTTTPSRRACPSPTARRTCRSTSRRCASWPRARSAIAGKDFKTGQTLMKTVIAPMLQGAHARSRGWFSTNILGNRDGEVLDDPDNFKTKEMSEARRARAHPAARALPGPLRQPLPQGAHQLLPAARRQQRGLGQHRHLRVARLPDADQGRLPVPRLDPGGADRARPGAVHGPGAARRPARHAGVAELLLQEPDDGARALPRARPVHPAHEAEEHAALDDGRDR